MVREDLITSAVSFLQDPSVASAPLDKRIAFLQSKNLTQEEIDLSLARASEDPNYTNSPAPPSPASSNYAHRQPPSPPSQGYSAYPPGFWQQPPPPELPKRDWRDWFIMATVMGGVSYGLYFTAKRYILPMISPPTPPQLAQDKASIDESFTRAFTLLDQLNTDTTALKASEDARTNRLDTALSEMESVLGSLKEASKRQGDDNRRVEDDVRSLRELIPKALDAQKETTDNRLKELGAELKSLKTLVGNRMSAGPTRPTSSGANVYGIQGSTPGVNGTSTTAVTQQSMPAVGGPVGGVTSAADSQGSVNATSSATPIVSTPERAQTSSPYGRLANGKAAIPTWQMAAAKNSQEAEKKDTVESGAATEASTSA
ncbi:hypothetical protein AOQ84DRAFT_343941 [Glonium stellatum]|uniref:Peroxisomal membrane protein PEX14 n=1 Tax=Glonium stellatum TaxID=574774 RepID=A0A8E2EW54_9PEZI|nr:hypothetical protein AOQ84DRAFT_343941 [Glonium stellatum]